MNRSHLKFCCAALILVLVSQPLVNAQKRSREELLKEAGRLTTEAERKQGEAIHKVRAGADRSLIREAEKLATENFEKAIELWREAGDDDRLIAAVEELTRIYSVLGEYERVLDRLTREAEYWRARGNVPFQARTLYTLGIRQSQMKRDTAATETLERVVTLSRSAGLRSLEPNALTQLATLYDKAGRVKEAAGSRQLADSLWSTQNEKPARGVIPPPVPPATLPEQWVDLPGAPVAAEYRVIQGVNEAVLVNRSSKVIRMVMFGCVALDDDGKTRVLHGLIGEAQSHGGVRPGSYYRPFLTLNGPLNRWTDQKMGCEGAAKMTLISAQFVDGTTWKADGIDWTR